MGRWYTNALTDKKKPHLFARKWEGAGRKTRDTQKRNNCEIRRKKENKGNKGPNQEKEIASFPSVQEEKQE